jgi:hypothetical protein
MIPFSSFLDAYGPDGAADRQAHLWWAAVLTALVILAGSLI